MDTNKIFIAEDDEMIAEALKKGLTAWGFEVACAEDLRKITEEITEFAPQIVLMDISLPYYNGFYRCGELRKISDVPVVFISSAADNMNIITAMSAGGDDFIAKPFDLNVLNAKLRAILRRTKGAGAEQQGLIFANGAVLNLFDASLTYNGEKTELTKNEYRIMETLLHSKGKIVSRSQLMNRLWETDCFVDENTLTVNIARLRKKLEGAGLHGIISTKVGLGYIIE